MKTKNLYYVEVPELGIKITPKQHFKGNNWAKISEKVPKGKIANYKILKKLRNIAVESKMGKICFHERVLDFCPWQKEE